MPLWASGGGTCAVLVGQIFCSNFSETIPNNSFRSARFGVCYEILGKFKKKLWKIPLRVGEMGGSQQQFTFY